MKNLLTHTATVLRKVNTDAGGGRYNTTYAIHIQKYKCRRIRYSKNITFDAPGGMVINKNVTFIGGIADIKDDDRLIWNGNTYRAVVRPIYQREKLHHLEIDAIYIGK